MATRTLRVLVSAIVGALTQLGAGPVSAEERASLPLLTAIRSAPEIPRIDLTLPFATSPGFEPAAPHGRAQSAPYNPRRHFFRHSLNLPFTDIPVRMKFRGLSWRLETGNLMLRGKLTRKAVTGTYKVSW